MDYLLDVRRAVLERIKATDAVGRLFSGGFDPQVYGRYLTNVWHYAIHSSTVIGLAGARAVRDNPKLADYLLHHAREELGHDEWALQDLAALGLDEATVRRTRPVPACAAMIGYEYYIAGHANPVGLFGWLYVLEAMGDDLGHIVSDLIEAGGNLPDGVKFLRGHGEADAAHTEDLTRQIRDNVNDRDRPDIHHVADVVGDLYVRIFEEIGRNGAA